MSSKSQWLPSHTHLHISSSLLSYAAGPLFFTKNSHQRAPVSYFRRADCHTARPEEFVSFLHAVIWIYRVDGIFHPPHPPQSSSQQHQAHSGRHHMETFEAARAEWISAGVVVFRDVPGGRFGRIILMRWHFFCGRFMSPDRSL